MGIQGLLTLVKPSSKSVHLSDLKGQTVAIDSYCWIHKGAFGCASKLGRGEETDAYVQYCFKFIDMLRSFKITPIMVFDGQNLPAKSITEEKRRESRAAAKKKAIECMRLNKAGEARMNFIKAVDVTPEMALKLIKACRKQNIDCIVAPYEADAQLAYLNQHGIVDLVITEDSDLLVFGCNKVLFKLDLSGDGVLVESDKLFLSMDEKPESFTLDKFRHMCILSGCDYIESLPGIGLKKAMKFIKSNSDADIYDVLTKLPTTLNMKNITVSKEYRDNFMIADATFRHQLVFDPLQRQLVPLTDPKTVGTNEEYLCNAGDIMDNNVAYQLALGNLSADDLGTMDNWCPDRDIPRYAFKPSIWSKSYEIHKKQKAVPIETKTRDIPKTKGTNIIFDVKMTEEEIKIEEKIKSDINKMYFEEPPLKKICLESSQKENARDKSPVLNTKRIFVKSRFFCNSKKESSESPRKTRSQHCVLTNVDVSNDDIVIEKLEYRDDCEIETNSETKTNILGLIDDIKIPSNEDVSSDIVDGTGDTLKTRYNIVDCEVRLNHTIFQKSKSFDQGVFKIKQKSTIITNSTECRRPGLAKKNSNKKFTLPKNQPTLSRFFKKN